MEKYCTACLSVKSLSCFYNYKRSKDGKTRHCKDCERDRKKKIYNKNLSKSRQEKRDLHEKRKQNGEYDEYYRRNRKHIIEKSKDRYVKNRDRAAEYQKKYYQENKESVNAYRNSYAINRSKKDVNYKLLIRLRSRLSCAVSKELKSGSAIGDLGCSIPELKKYLEAQFTKGMTWDNYGLHGWHIDHIRPLASFNLSDPEDFKEANHYTNLQPLWAKDNLRKGSKAHGDKE